MSQPILRSDYEQAIAFIASDIWRLPEPVYEADRHDPILNKINEKYGAFMNSFDFHLTPQGPKLIEINNNADGYTTTCAMYKEFD